MKRLISGIAILAVFSLALAPVAPAVVFAADQGEQVSMDQLPAPVKATIEKESKGGTVQGVTKETDKKGKTLYEAHIQTSKGKDRYVHVSEAGKVTKRESAKKEAKEEKKTEKSSTK